jgi:aminoglycoside 3-N-acetyltransferase I
MDASVRICRLGLSNVALVRELNALFGEAFRASEEYTGAPPVDAYLSELLTKEHMTVLVALVGEQVVGGLVAYELDKFERQRREMYIYDLAVASDYRRRGIATALIEKLRETAMRRSVWVIYVQADYGDDAAIALYESLGSREDVMHFDILVAPSNQISSP